MSMVVLGGHQGQAGKAGGFRASHGGKPKAAARSEPLRARRSAAPPGRSSGDWLDPARLLGRLATSPHEHR